MKKSKNSVQGLIGLERFTKYGVKTDKAEIAFFSVEPTKMNTTTMTLYTGRAFSPNRALKLDWPKKYHPMMVENAKKNRQTATKMIPALPNPFMNAA